MAIRSAIRFWRTERKLTQSELVEKTGIRQDQLSRYETGQGTPSIDELTRIAEALGVTPAHLYSDEIVREIRASEEVA